MTQDTIKTLERAIAEGRPFVFVADLGGDKIHVSGPVDRDWLEKVLTAVLAGVRGSPDDPLNNADKYVEVRDAKQN